MNFRERLLEIKRSGRRVLVVGLGISGFESALFLARCGIAVLVAEAEQREAYVKKSALAGRLSELEAKNVDLHFGIRGENVAPLLESVELCILSPGVSLESAICGVLTREKIPCVSELELGIEIKGAPALIVTGSNGKSTTVTLIAHLLRAAGFRAHLCGNVGVPVVAALGLADLQVNSAAADEIQVVEASSYQLESCRVVKPKVGILLNISDNHLERHGTLERYAACKAQLFKQQDHSDFALLNLDDKKVRELAPRLAAKVLWFGCDARQMEGRQGALITYDPKRGSDRIEFVLDQGNIELDLKGCRLLGLHNRYNIASALLACKALGCDTERLLEALRSFQPLEHRLEIIGSGAPLRVINDSKSTTVASSLAALRAIEAAFPEGKISLLLGGQVKAGSWAPLLQELKRVAARLHPVVAFGADGRILQSHLQSAGLPHELASNVADGWRKASEQCRPGDTVLFSPGAASFDEFRDFEERGAYFKSLAHASGA